MIWKPKERQLTREEAIELAQKELKPLWFGTQPLLAGIRAGSKITAHPLDARVLSSDWLVTLLDATSFSGNHAMATLSEWNSRYAHLGFEFLLVLRFKHPRLFRPFAIASRFEAELARGLKIAFDHDGTLSMAFGASEVDFKSVFLKKGTPCAETGGTRWAYDTETLLQKMLREKDPGLPLLPPLVGVKTPRDVAHVEFGTSAKSALFRILPESDHTGEPGMVTTIGHWERDDQMISTSDPEAKLMFRCPSPEFAALVMPQEKRPQSQSRLAITVNGMPAYEEHYGPTMKMDEDGLTSIPLGPSWFYRPLIPLPEKFRDITLSFPDAKTTQASLFGIRFGE